MALSEALRAHLRSIVDAHPVVLFMKGTRLSPQCGFSATVVGILDAMLPTYHTVDVLADPAVREGLRDFSEWPTFPQLYAKGQFVGGTDIVQELQSRGELAAMLGVAVPTVKVPAITVSAKAAELFREAATEAEGLVLRFQVSSGFRYDLMFADRADGDVIVEVAPALAMHLDPGSAYRADGSTIDYVVGSQGGGFVITNPNEPARVRPLTPAKLKAMMDAGEDFELVDVRSPQEWNIAHLYGARLFDAAFEHDLLAMDRGARLVFMCHHGVRSAAAAEHFVNQGFREVYNLEGGIDAWSLTIDHEVDRY